MLQLELICIKCGQSEINAEIYKRENHCNLPICQDCYNDHLDNNNLEICSNCENETSELFDNELCEDCFNVEVVA